MKNLIKFYLKKQIKYFTENVINDFERDTERDRSYFCKLEKPTSDFDRTVLQFKCQIYSASKVVIFSLNVFSFFLIPFVIIYFCLKKKVTRKNMDHPYLALNCSNTPNVFPNELLYSDRNIIDKRIVDKGKLQISDLFFIFSFVRSNPLYYWLTLRVIYKVSLYRHVINTYQPYAIIITGENSVTSSVMTNYCNRMGVLHYNIMQGEMFSTVLISFFHFNKCFVWDEHYKQEFQKYGAVSEQFVVSKPQCLMIDIEKNKEDSLLVDYTYYLSTESAVELKEIKSNLDKFKLAGKTYRVRPHFRWTNMSLVASIFSQKEIEDFNKLDIYKSISSTKCIISLYSTVLYQAYSSNCKIIVDDLTNIGKFKRLKDLNYIILSKNPNLLSAELNDVVNFIIK